jgi:heme-degrading monooxygenase HmoA
MFVSTLRRQTTVTKADEFEQRKTALLARLLPYLQKQPGFVSHELTRDGDNGAMVEITRWATEDDRRRYLRGGAAAMSATWLDGYLPTAPYPNGTWLREYSND